jgi:hypothetical protein
MSTTNDFILAGDWGAALEYKSHPVTKIRDIKANIRFTDTGLRADRCLLVA